jgi:hypothetical protein
MASRRMRMRHAMFAMALLLAAPHAQASAPAPAPAAQQSDLDEIVVQGQRVQLQEMRKELVRLEDRFYARYDELNTNDDFDIHCFKEARTGTRIIKRTCRAVYEDNALQEEGQAALAIRQYVQPGLQTYKYKDLPDPRMLVGETPAPPIMAILARLDEFRANMKDVVSRDPQLLGLLRDRAELARRYEATRRRIFKRHPAAADAASGDADPQ